MTTRPWWSAGADWTATADWWTDPAQAYLAGLIHGAALERERRDALDDHEHREHVREIIRFIERVDGRGLRRRRAS